MLVYFYFFLFIIFLSIPASIIFTRLRYLNKYPDKYIVYYNGHEEFINVFSKIIRFYISKFYNFLKIIYQYILHIWVQIIARVNSLSEKAYTVSRDKFMDEIVKDKKAVPHFWGYLKKYKKEIDKEKEDSIDDNISNNL